MQAFLESLLVVAVAEIGDRTQLLSLVLASHFRKPVPILAGILVATLANHALAGLVGEWVGAAIDGPALRWALGIGFLGMAAWALVPDQLGTGEARGTKRGGAFLATLVGFFIAEIGDKTQIATAALAARFEDLLWVVIGTTSGMMIANLPIVVFGHFAGNSFDPRWARYGAALLLAAQGLLALFGARSV
ncbi:MAG: TMEM165/GDT1 family protein [Alphaproteobacteria bacterium]|nr:TMEM165/GDT1 family protein [Alphaproteobacteria bacterium]